MAGETVLDEIRNKIAELGGVDSIYGLTEIERRRATLLMEGFGYAEIGRLEVPPRSRGAVSSTLNVVYSKCFMTGNRS